MSNQDVIARLHASREALIGDGEQILATAAEANRDLAPEEEDRLKEIKADAEKRAARIAELEAYETEVAKAAEARAKYDGVLAAQGTTVQPGRQQEHIYRPGAQHSFFFDQLMAQRGDSDAAARLNRHNKLMESMYPEVRDMTTGATSAGGFIPPKWLVEKTANVDRVGRPIADLIPNLGAPPAASMSVPKVSTGLVVAAQNGENTAITDNDLVTTSVTHATRTIAGKTDVSLQAVELGGSTIDTIIYNDLRQAYNAELDRQVLVGTDTNGTLLGILNVTGTNAVAYTDASPTVAELYPKVLNAAALIHTNRFLPAQAIAMSPLRWAWIEAGVDSTGRPFVPPIGPMNAFGDGNQAAQGPSGSLAGYPVYTDANIPANLGGGTEDEIVVFRPSDMFLFEGPVRTEASRDAGFNTLSVAFRVYAFVNFFPDRFPKSISEINGTGLVPPTF